MHQPYRVLHVIGSLNPGGVERWLLDVARRADQERWRHDMMVHVAGGLDTEKMTEAGAHVIHCPLRPNPERYALRLWRLLRSGCYDVVHSHVHHFSGIVLTVARAQGIPVRVAHSHSDTRSVQRRARLARRAYFKCMRMAIHLNATAGIGASSEAAQALFGEAWRTDQRYSVMHCGIDLAPFSERFRPESVRESLGIPVGAIVLGHVGSFVRAKNHEFLLRIAAAAMTQEPRCRLLLVGDGPLRKQAMAESERLGIADRVSFAGVRGDVARLLAATDVFVFPSLHEGLPLSMVEAQAAGVPVVASDRITREAEVGVESVAWLPLEVGAEAWADVCLSAKGVGYSTDRRHSLQRVAESSFDIERSWESLRNIYEEALTRHAGVVE